ncbi:hypothetical protein PCC9214_04330 [Planktothrix tepida]|uniref:DUF1902 domain-containing protein n=2 Tax=Planktothrix TaxID=54304 RepID=A0A1J1LUY6_9CYAN|nr:MULTISPECIES: hypothetical protein [Planktothrix]CAD5931309.1 hypothetical protein NO713_01306 [Planktothrix pseudagardhii]CAD5977916.1 hypothetical protein PCC9214_04330 [Planktothrix tepida]CUR36030.1 hypothetical protein PL921480140 [Planktothrix tepida PCC 9214]
MKNTLLRCFLKQENNQWVAVCIDLNLASQADTCNEAKLKLEEMINSYVQEALTVDSDYAEQLLSRKAPFTLILEYYFAVLLENLPAFNPAHFQIFSGVSQSQVV